MKDGIDEPTAFGMALVATVLIMLIGAYFMSTTPQAQARPYVAYPVYAGCLYITPQGYAVIGQMVPGGSCQ